MKEIVLGIFASFFFAVTFVLNRSMDLSGGSWIWSAVLRYVFMVPPLIILVLIRGNLRPLLFDFGQRPGIFIHLSVKGLAISLIILVGIALIQFQQAEVLSTREVILGVLPVLVASFAYPLGNRKMMATCGAARHLSESSDLFLRHCLF